MTMMKLAGRELKKLIREELSRQLLEQAGTDVALSDEAKTKASEAGENIEQNNTETMASITGLMDTTPGLDHTSMQAALASLQRAQTELGAVISGLFKNEGGEESPVMDETDHDSIG